MYQTCICLQFNLYILFYLTKIPTWKNKSNPTWRRHWVSHSLSPMKSRSWLWPHIWMLNKGPLGFITGKIVLPVFLLYMKSFEIGFWVRWAKYEYVDAFWGSFSAPEFGVINHSPLRGCSQTPAMFSSDSDSLMPGASFKHPVRHTRTDKRQFSFICTW